MRWRRRVGRSRLRSGGSRWRGWNSIGGDREACLAWARSGLRFWATSCRRYRRSGTRARTTAIPCFRESAGHARSGVAALGERLLETELRTLINAAWRADNLCVSTISSWELKLLKRKQRIRFPDDVGAWRRELLAQSVIEIPVDGSIGIRAASLQDFHADPADRMIVATALEEHQLVTADHSILGWSGALDRMDARV